MLINGVLDYAVELRLLTTNPVKGLKVTAPKIHTQVDPRTVVNHEQARRLLTSVRKVPTNGSRLVAFFALMYYAALRPEEALAIRRRNVALPDAAAGARWGELRLEKAASHAGAKWTDSGLPREERSLKQRAVGETRPVPVCPPLVEILHRHLTAFTDSPESGLLFYGVRSGRPLDPGVYRRVWIIARENAFTEVERASPLARQPHNLRHACVSTWLAAGVPAPDVAGWAGHGVDVLLRVYAQCIDGQAETAYGRIERALAVFDDAELDMDGDRGAI